MDQKSSKEIWPHKPVLAREWLEVLSDRKITCALDATVGAGGHAALVLEAHLELQQLIALDQDETALQIAKKRLSEWESKVSFIHANFNELEPILEKVPHLDVAFFDIGVSSMQLDTPERGFSFMQEGPLDMRMNQKGELTAHEVVNEWPEEELAQVIRDFGEEKKWRKAARVIVAARKEKEVETTSELANILENALRHPYEKTKIHPATLVFQAIRIAVNNELGILENSLKCAFEHLKPGGVLGVITFHSLEDRIVKRLFRYLASDKESTDGIGGVFLDKEPAGNDLTRRPLTAQEDELDENPRARSAKLRVIEKR